MISQEDIIADISYYKSLRKAFTNRARKGKQYSWYLKHQHGKPRVYVLNHETGKETYIKKKDIGILCMVIGFQLYEQYLEIIDQNIDMLERMRDNYVCLAGRNELAKKEEFMVRIMAQLEGTFVYGNPQFDIPDPIDHSLKGPFRYNPFFPENLIHKTPAGILMRSREEAAIGTYLEAEGIEYQYDTEMRANGRRYYVDFLVRRWSDGEWIIWEHFGVKSKLKYDRKTMRKHIDYRKEGYRLGDNYICSYEDDNGGLDMVVIARLVNTYIKCN